MDHERNPPRRRVSPELRTVAVAVPAWGQLVRGETLLRVGDPADEIYVVLTGDLKEGSSMPLLEMPADLLELVDVRLPPCAPGPAERAALTCRPAAGA
jgi:hypothetical protein